jgi:hypothetical protein
VIRLSLQTGYATVNAYVQANGPLDKRLLHQAGVQSSIETKGSLPPWIEAGARKAVDQYLLRVRESPGTAPTNKRPVMETARRWVPPGQDCFQHHRSMGPRSTEPRLSERDRATLATLRVSRWRGCCERVTEYWTGCPSRQEHIA